jgi:thiol-disulfide isomerase/thioredoxin
MLTRRTALALGLAGLPAACNALPREQAPDFRGRTLEGKTFSRESLKGKSVLIQFWATWCGYCRKDEPFVEALVHKYGDNLVVLAVNVQEEERKVRQYLAASGRRSTVVLSKDTNLPAIFGVNGFPTYIYLDADSHVVAQRPGAQGEEGFRRMLGLSAPGSVRVS